MSITLSSTLAVPTLTTRMTAVQAQTAKEADKAMNALLHQPELVQSLVDTSHPLVPVSNGRVMALLWAIMNDTGGSFVYKSGVDRATSSVGGSSTQKDALWKMISPEGKLVSPGDFAVSEYLKTVISSNLTDIRETVEQRRRDEMALQSSTSIMDFLHGGATSVLSNFGGQTGTALDLFS